MNKIGCRIGLAFAARCRAYLLLAVAALLAACGEEPKKAPPAIRAVKTIIVQPQAAVRVRRLSGLVQAVNVSQLSFEVSGNVSAIARVIAWRIHHVA